MASKLRLFLDSPTFNCEVSLLCDCGNVYKQKEKFDFSRVMYRSMDKGFYLTKRRSECPDCTEASLLKFHLKAYMDNEDDYTVECSVNS